MTLSPGSRFGSFEILGLLGAGGMGEVYRARDPRLSREVALKTLPADLAHSPDFRVRFEREGRFLAALNHPHVAAIYGLEDHEGITALVLELVDGPMLEEWIGPEKRPVEDVLRLAGQIAAALEAAHQRGIVHRDLKPTNVRIGSDGRVKVLDFGIALALAPEGDTKSDTATLTAPGTILGTPGYLAPEQAASGRADARSDVWAFGAILFEMLALRPAFLRPTRQETLAAVLMGQVAWEALPPAVPATVRTLLENCLSLDASRRPADGAALRARLDACSAMPALNEPPALLVLPFENLRGDTENESFADGLTEEVIADLVNIDALRVFSRATAMRYRAERRDATQAARELGARYVLDGSVRRVGANVRVTVQLVEASKDTPVWADKYGGSIEDVFAIQETISRSIASALRLTFAAALDRRFAERRRGSAVAYDVYLTTRADVDSFTLARLERARIRLERALAELGPDPYLYRGLGRVAWQYVNGGFSRDRAHGERLDDCIQRLEAMDLGGAHAVVLRALRASTSGDVGAWFRALEQAEAANPADTEARLWKALLLSWTGHTEEGRAIIGAVGEVDPYNEYVLFGRCLAAVLEGRFEDARRVTERGLEDHPGSAVWPTFLGQICAMAGDHEGARAAIEGRLSDPHAGGMASLAHVFAAALTGDQPKVRGLVTPEFEALMWNDFQYAHMMAQSYSLLGATDEALRWLERAVARGFVHHRFLGDIDSLLARLRGEERFRELMDRARKASEAFPGETVRV